MKKSILYVLIVISVHETALASEKETAAQEATLEWLSQVDSREYVQSWENAASLFRRQISSSQWVTAVAGVREPLGDVKTRVVRSATYATSLPGAPDGEYVVIQFQTVFTNKAAAIETVTPMLDAGTWRVSGYFIK